MQRQQGKGIVRHQAKATPIIRAEKRKLVFPFLSELYLASHDSTDGLNNGSFFHCASRHSRQQRCVQKVVARGHQRDVVLLAA